MSVCVFLCTCASCRQKEATKDAPEEAGEEADYETVDKLEVGMHPSLCLYLRMCLSVH